jgi:hypothetical protein
MSIPHMATSMQDHWTGSISMDHIIIALNLNIYPVFLFRKAIAPSELHRPSPILELGTNTVIVVSGCRKNRAREVALMAAALCQQSFTRTGTCMPMASFATLTSGSPLHLNTSPGAQDLKLSRLEILLCLLGRESLIILAPNLFLMPRFPRTNVDHCPRGHEWPPFPTTTSAHYLNLPRGKASLMCPLLKFTDHSVAGLSPRGKPSSGKPIVSPIEIPPLP